MATATLTSKGQITVPAKVREELGLKAGDRLEFVRNQRTGRYEIIPATISVRSLEGMLHRPGRKPVSIEEMNEAIAEMGSGRG
ncbi:AbrB/MazE/SpoVT family DNA-binding domain-containing protein [Silvibacterium dinghuense]|uniref:AbrB/MazE/SpoVT family DNA-binding domain-containing protein n=1 Tax=Silvibacterium dinghuense TaxID=1560006 RepID=A0A4Q1S8E1_9BACT|nr:AbrB/MazE/SpoVT family DNA-binding domain-containing protein [Silvibacterium dinghuense]RXS93280.1 AbrB/MazE/SpoVT family DNA-binding domain-containing protein [Silvibacterium dinghuense]GGH04524.1 AbrB family transcriptional regulator [Silvibacterium dinghuense]